MSKKLLSVLIWIAIIGGVFYFLNDYLKSPTEVFGTSELQIANDLTDLKATIEADLQPNGKYKRRTQETINGVEYETHEYETSKGEIGYVIYMTREDKDGIYKKVVNSGVETHREKDWYTVLDKTIVVDNTPSSTPK